jgi:arginine N-succinyltransferase
VVRPARTGDVDQIVRLAALAGPGFTSLVVGRDALAERVAWSEQCFASDVRAPGEERYVLVAEDANGNLLGLSGLKATIGITQPFFNFKMLTIAQSSPSVGQRFDLDVLMMVNEFAGCSEVGSLFVTPEARKLGAGRLLATARYQLIAAQPQRFAGTILAELRGVTDEAGHSPFWEAVGSHFFRMTFEEADRLSSGPQAQFLLDLMPRFPIYVDLLPEAARAVIGQPHVEGAGAYRLLLAEGFTYGRVVDVFDAGPLVSARRDQLETVRRSRVLRARAGAGQTRALVSAGEAASFRVTLTHVGAEDGLGAIVIAPEALRALDVTEGDPVMVREI